MTWCWNLPCPTYFMGWLFMGFRGRILGFTYPSAPSQAVLVEFFQRIRIQLKLAVKKRERERIIHAPGWVRKGLGYWFNWIHVLKWCPLEAIDLSNAQLCPHCADCSQISSFLMGTKTTTANSWFIVHWLSQNHMYRVMATTKRERDVIDCAHAWLQKMGQPHLNQTRDKERYDCPKRCWAGEIHIYHLLPIG